MIEPFIRKAKVGGLNDCWEWQGTRNGQGYGFHYFEGRTEGAHRVSHKLFHGPIPKGMETMHSCDNPPCVNPNHLSLGTKLENMTDAVQKGRCAHIGANNAKKTHCPHGHPYDLFNTFITKGGDGRPFRKCRECSRIRQRNKRCLSTPEAKDEK